MTEPPKPLAKEYVISYLSYVLAVTGVCGLLLITRLPVDIGFYALLVIFLLLGFVVLAIIGLEKAKRMRNKRIQDAEKAAKELEDIAIAEAFAAHEMNKQLHYQLDKMQANELAEFVASIFAKREDRVSVERKTSAIFILRINHNEQRWVAFVHKTSNDIGVGEIRKLYEVMTQESVDKGFYFATEAFTRQAIDWAREKPLRLIDQNALVLMLREQRDL